MLSTGPMSLDTTLTLTEDERTELLALLEQAVREKGVEAHRTEARAFRQAVERQEAIFRRLLDRLRRP